MDNNTFITVNACKPISAYRVTSSVPIKMLT